MISGLTAPDGNIGLFQSVTLTVIFLQNSMTEQDSDLQVECIGLRKIYEFRYILLRCSSLNQVLSYIPFDRHLSSRICQRSSSQSDVDPSAVEE